MADAPRSIFNKAATERLRSADDLDKYIRVTNPSVWVVLAACIALLLGLLAWGVFGAVSTSVSTTGASVDGQVVCYLSADDVAKVHVGDLANVAGEQMEVSSIASIPASRDEAKVALGKDYLVDVLVSGSWAYPVTFEAADDVELDEGVPLPVSITTERVAPISLILGKPNA